MSQVPKRGRQGRRNCERINQKREKRNVPETIRHGIRHRGFHKGSVEEEITKATCIDSSFA